MKRTHSWMWQPFKLIKRAKALKKRDESSSLFPSLKAGAIVGHPQ
jgi:hypothetical protein